MVEIDTILQESMNIAIDVALDIYGNEFNVYYPTSSDSIYEEESQEYVYSNVPDLERERLLVINMVQGRRVGGSYLDPFLDGSEQPQLLQHVSDPLFAVGTKLTFSANDSASISFRVVDSSIELTGVHKSMFRKTNLEPFV